jgi:hypothetical protein
MKQQVLEEMRSQAEIGRRNAAPGLDRHVIRILYGANQVCRPCCLVATLRDDVANFAKPAPPKIPQKFVLMP